MITLDQPGLIKGILKKIAYIVLVAFPLVMMGLVIWGINKGFDITDEAYYLSGFQAGQEKFFGVSVFHLLVISKLFGFLDNIITVRILSVVLTLLGGIVFSIGFFRLIEYIYRPHLPTLHKWVMGIWLIGMSFYWSSAYPLTFSYNVLINAAMLLIMGLVFYMIPCAEAEKNRTKVAFMAVIIGIITSISFLVKIPATLLFIGLSFALLIIFWIEKSKVWIFIVLSGMAAGFITGILLVFFGLGALNGFELFFQSGQVILGIFSPLEIINRFFEAMFDLLNDLFSYSWLIIVLFFVFGFSFISNLSSRTKKWIYLILMGWLIVYLYSGSGFFVEVVYTNLKRMPALGLFLLAICLLLEIIGLNAFFQKRSDIHEASPGKLKILQKTALGVCLIFLPFAASLGTTNLLLWQAWLHITPWCGLVILLMQEIEGRKYFRVTAWIVLIVLAVWAPSRWINTYLYRPYRLAENRLQQTEVFPIDTPALQGIRVDKPTQKFFQGLKTMLSVTHFKPGDEIIAAYDLPGLVVGLGGFSPGSPWIFDAGDDAFLFCSQFKTTYLDHSRAILILKRTLPPEITSCLKKNQINFPDDYSLAGTIESPFRKETIEMYYKK